MRVEPFCQSGPGGDAGDPPYFMVGLSLQGGWGLGLFLRKGRAIDPGTEVAAANLWIGKGDLLVTVDRGRLLPRVGLQWTWIGPLRPRPA